MNGACDSDFLHNIPAEEDKKNHVQRQCPECREWVVWVPKDQTKRVHGGQGVPRYDGHKRSPKIPKTRTDTEP
jgi:hypothetical protein